MTCYYPNTAHVAGLNKNGNKLLNFGLPEKSNQESFLLPCGQCIGCRLDKSIQWAARCMHESQMHETSAFITLTYDEENLPERGSLTPHHFVNFLKRYRHYVSPEKIRFFHGAEYGEKLSRPHHHACIFGHEFTDTELFRECEGIHTYYSPTLEKLWGHGFCTTTELTLQSAAYVARYCMKKINIGKNTPHEQREHYAKTCEYTGETYYVLPEYATMSRKPGIGREWYDVYNSDIFPHDTTIYKGKKIKTPRYYEEILRSTDNALFELIKENRKRASATEKAQFENTPARLRVREKVKIASMANITRNLHDES